MVSIKSKMLKATIIAISMATVFAGTAVAPALGEISKAFPEVDEVFIKLILTLPSLMIIPFTFIASYLTTKITKRSILFIGLTIYLIGGLGAQFMNSIGLILLFRLILGMGVGLIVPLSMSLINDNFIGRERTQMMGLNSAFTNFSGIITVMLAGFLASHGWRLPFNVYLLGIVIMFFVYFYLPKNEIYKPQKDETKLKIPKIIYGYGLAMGGVMIANFAIQTNMALFLEQNNIGGPSLAGVVISFITVGGMLTNLFLARLDELFGKYFITMMLLGMGIAFMLLSVSTVLPLIIISVSLVGFGGALLPLLTVKAFDRVEPHQADQTVAITISFVFLGQFISPIVLDTIGKLFNNNDVQFKYAFLSVVILIIVAINVFLLIRKRSYQVDEK